MSKKSFIDSVKVGEACSEDWEKMDGNDRFRFCSHCSKHVNNLSEMTRKEAARFVRASNGNICIRYIVDPRSQRPMFANQLHQIARRAPGLTAGVMTASMALSTAAYAQSEPVVANAKTASVRVEQTKTDVPKEKAKEPDRSARISGTITDPNGAVIPGATITIAGLSATYNGSATSDGEGVYRLENLKPGTYQIESTSQGFMTSSRTITIAEQEEKIEDASLEVGRIELTVDIVSDVSLETSVSGGIMATVEYTSPLSRAVADEDVDAVRDLISKGEKVNAKEDSYSKITPLFVAVEQGNIEIVQMLLDAGAKVNARDSEKQTPLMRIDGDATPELIAVLIRSGAKVGLTDNEGNTALILSAYYTPADTLQALIDAGADINHANNEGYTALMRAAENGSVETVKMLLEAGAQVNAVNEDGDNAWDLTSNDEVKELLATYGSRVKIQDEEKPSLSTIIQ